MSGCDVTNAATTRPELNRRNPNWYWAICKFRSSNTALAMGAQHRDGLSINTPMVRDLTALACSIAASAGPRLRGYH